MGVHELTTYIKDYVPDGFTDVSIVEECDKFKRVNGRKPEIIIDILGTVDVIANFDPINNEINKDLAKKESLCGGRLLKYQKTCEILFGKLKEVADLVFYKDGTVRPEKINVYTKKKNKSYHKMIEVIDMINQRRNLTEIIENSKDFPFTVNHVMIIIDIAKNYGRFETSITRECDTEMVKYANDNKSFAILSCDSDFLIFEGDWRFFSLNDLKIADLNSLSTKEFNKKALWNTLGLTNSFQMSLLATLNGNDYIHAKSFKELHSFHLKLTKRQNSAQMRFAAIAELIINELSNQEQSIVIEKIANKFRFGARMKIRLKVAQSIKMYTDFTLNIPSDPNERFCVETSNTSIFFILTKSIKIFKIRFRDLHNETPKLHEVEIDIFRKQAGIVLMHRKNEDIELEVAAKQTHTDNFPWFKVKPDYPPMEYNVPLLIQLLSDKLFPDLEQNRFELLQWIIDVDEAEIKQLPTKYVHDILMLNFMRRREFIEVFEADLMLLTIKLVQDGNYDETFDEIPDILNKRAFQLQFLISNFQSMISQSFKVCGLGKRFVSKPNFDFEESLEFWGVIFNNLYLMYPTESENPAVIKLLDDLVPYRLYA